jgi:hypothetical protein
MCRFIAMHPLFFIIQTSNIDPDQGRRIYFRRITILGQDWSCFGWIKHSVGRDNAYNDEGITNLGQDWSCYVWIKHSVGRDNAYNDEGITNLGQDWLCLL